MNNIILYQTNEHIFLNFYWVTRLWNIFNDQNWGWNWCFKHGCAHIFNCFNGIYFARVQGIQTLRSGIVNLYQNKVPVYELIAGASIAFAALLLIIPGFFTDFIGFLLLFPFSRNFLLRVLIKKNEKKINDIKKSNNTIDGEIIDKKKDEL